MELTPFELLMKTMTDSNSGLSITGPFTYEGQLSDGQQARLEGITPFILFYDKDTDKTTIHIPT